MRYVSSSLFSNSHVDSDHWCDDQIRPMGQHHRAERYCDHHRTLSLAKSRSARPALSGALISKSQPFFGAHQDQRVQDHGLADNPPKGATSSLNAFGMFWNRSHVYWPGSPRLLGKQKATAAHVNFAEQIGVYLLHDRERTIYVGRTLEALHTRLKTHTLDRMAGRWDRFSWFGLRGVGADGSLIECPPAWLHSSMVETMEAVLIESLEPPLNRKRGDRISGSEYLQVADPEVERYAKRQLLADIMRTVGLESL